MSEEKFCECIRMIQAGDAGGLEQIYEAYVRYIFAVIYKITGRPELSENLTSEFFIKLWKISDCYRPGGNHRQWMARIAHNLAVDELRRTGKETVSESVQASLHGEMNAETDVVSRLSVEAAMAGLDEKDADIYV